MTWKMKNLVIKESSSPDLLGMPSNLARRRSTIGRSIIRTASKTGGRIPEMMPTTTFGSLHIQASQDAVRHSWETLDTAPTKATARKMERQ
jgi:hypothetical protein